MTTVENKYRLHSHLVNMIALESAIDQKLGDLLPKVTSHAEVTALLTKSQLQAADQRLALETRLQEIGGKLPLSSEPLVTVLARESNEEDSDPVSTALQIAYTLFNQAIIGYATLHTFTTRFLDGAMVADEGTSYHLCRQHMQDYIEAAQQVTLLLHDVVIWELDQDNLACQCTCPSCGVGVCVCALAGRSFLRDAWAEAGPIAGDDGVYIQSPRQESAAEKIGLHRGDVIHAADGNEIEEYGDLQDLIRNTEPGKEIRLTILRKNDGKEDVVMVRP